MPTGIEVSLKDDILTVKGSKGQLERKIHRNIKVEIKDNEIIVTRPNDSKINKSLHGLFRSLIANMVEGVSKGYEKKLEIVGVGYRAKANKNKITLNLGFSHPIEYKAPEDVEFHMDEDNKNIITVKGINKETVGEVAAKIRSYRKPEPYKGKGIKYIDEHIIRKAGKTAVK
ncbi:50S ribosomal protein L6 [Patescibacteria group bacterium]